MSRYGKCENCGMELTDKNSEVQSLGQIVWRTCKVCGARNKLELF